MVGVAPPSIRSAAPLIAAACRTREEGDQIGDFVRLDQPLQQRRRVVGLEKALSACSSTHPSRRETAYVALAARWSHAGTRQMAFTVTAVPLVCSARPREIASSAVLRLNAVVDHHARRRDSHRTLETKTDPAPLLSACPVEMTGQPNAGQHIGFEEAPPVTVGDLGKRLELRRCRDC